MLRDVLTTVPHGRTSLLRLPLDFIDIGSVKGSLPRKFLPDESMVLDGVTTWDPTGPIGPRADVRFHEGPDDGRGHLRQRDRRPADAA